MDGLHKGIINLTRRTGMMLTTRLSDKAKFRPWENKSDEKGKENCPSPPTLEIYEKRYAPRELSMHAAAEAHASADSER
jgi:hypothetical protein